MSWNQVCLPIQNGGIGIWKMFSVPLFAFLAISQCIFHPCKMILIEIMLLGLAVETRDAQSSGCSNVNN